MSKFGGTPTGNEPKASSFGGTPIDSPDPRLANEQLSRGLMYGAVPTEIEFANSVMTEQDKERTSFKLYSDTKHARNFSGPELEALRVAQYGKDSTWQTANAYNAKGAKWAKTKAVAKDIAVDAPKEIPKGFARGTQQTLGAVGSMVEAGGDYVAMQQRMWKGIFYDSPIGQKVLEKRRAKYEATKGDGTGTEARLFEPKKSAGKEVSEFGEYVYDFWKESADTGWEKRDSEIYKGTFKENPSFARVAGGAAESAPTMIGALALSAAGAPNAGAMLLAGSEALPIYTEAKRRGMSEKDAFSQALVTGIGTSALEKFGLNSILGKNPAVNKMVKKLGGNWVAGAVVNFANEGTQEALQELYQNAVAIGYEDDISVFQGVLEAGIIGGVVGGASSVSTKIISEYMSDEASSARKASAEGKIDALVDGAIGDYGHAVIDAGSNIIPWTLGDASVMRKQNTNEQIAQIVSNDPEVRDDAAGQELMSELLLNPSESAAEALNSHLFEEDQDSGEQPAKVKQKEQATESTATEDQPKTDALPSEGGGADRDASFIGLTKEEGQIIREDKGYESLPPAKKIQFKESINKAKAEGLDNRAFELAGSLMNKPRALKPEEHASFVVRAAQLETELDSLLRENEDAVILGSDISTIQSRMSNINSELDMITRAADLTGTEAGRALSARRIRINKKTYELANTVRRAISSKQAGLTQDEQSKFVQMESELREWEDLADSLQKDIEKLEADALIKQAETFIQESLAEVKVRRKKAAIKSDRDSIKKELMKMGYRMNDISGVTVDAARLISKLAKTYIEEGATTLDQVAKQVGKDIPDLSKKDFYDAFGSRIKSETTRVKTDAAKTLTELKKQATLMGKIEDAMNGIFAEKRTNKPSSAEVRGLQKHLRQLEATAKNTIRDDAEVERIIERAMKIEDMVLNRYREAKKPKKVDSDQVKAAKELLSDARSKLRVQDKITEYQRIIKEDDYESLMTPRQRRTTKDVDLIEARFKAERMRKKIDKEIFDMRKRTVGDYATEAVNVSRALLATADMSAVLRQGALLGVGHPLIAGKSFVMAGKAFFSTNTAQRVDFMLKNNPNQMTRDKYGLYLSDVDGKLSKREESFSSDIVKNMPSLLGGDLVRGSERHMTSYINMLRASVFDDFIKKNPDASEESKRAMARYINVATGRGELGNFEGAARQLSAVFFSPRFAISRIQAPAYAIKGAVQHKEMRKELGRQWGAMLGTGLSVLALAKLGGADVEDDPESSEWGKIRLGKVVVDIFAGMQQPMRLLALSAKSAAYGLAGKSDDIDYNLPDAWFRFLKYKLSPAITSTYQITSGKHWVTDKDITKAEAAAGSFVPIIFQTAMDVVKEDLDTTESSLALVSEFFGAGSQVYKKK